MYERIKKALQNNVINFILFWIFAVLPLAMADVILRYIEMMFT